MTLPTIEDALEATRESRHIEFKSAFDPHNTGEWCELIKDIIAIANSGGGYILIGANDSGQPVGYDAAALLALDQAQVVDKICKYVGPEFDAIEVFPVSKTGQTIAMLKIDSVDTPLPFIKPGEYEQPVGTKKKAFAEGTVYFRHGAKSATASRNDLRAFVRRAEQQLRRELQKNLSRVVKAQSGSTIIVERAAHEAVPPEFVSARLVDDPQAPAFRRSDPDTTHPFRAKEVISEVKLQLPDDTTYNNYDITCIRYVHNIDANPAFAHKPKFGSRQYSETFVRWIVEMSRQDPHFFEATRTKYAES